MYNKITLCGRICNDLSLKTTPQNISVLSFRMAVERQFQAKGEDRKVDFFNVVAWRNTAEFISRYFSKGKPILIDGEINSRKYTDKYGAEREVWEVVVDRACFVGDKSSNNCCLPSNSNESSGNSDNLQNYEDYETAEDYPF